MSKHVITKNSALARVQSNTNEWFTPHRYVEAARRIMGSIELDPASCREANKIIQAERYYTKEQNGLMLSWECKSMFMNPPYGRVGSESNQDIWTAKLIAEYETGKVKQAVLLVNAVTDTVWFQRLWQYPICLTDHRISFVSPRGGVKHPTLGSAFVYFGSQIQRFDEIFRGFGRIIPPLEKSDPIIAELWSA